MTKDAADRRVVFKEDSYRFIGAYFEVYKEMGRVFVEPFYQECLKIELVTKNIPFQSQQQLRLSYKQAPLKQIYIPDFVRYEKFIIEIKDVSKLCDELRAQLHNDLRAVEYRLG